MNVCFGGKNGHGADLSVCPLVTLSGLSTDCYCRGLVERLRAHGFRAAPNRKLTDGALDVEFDSGHLREQINIDAPDRTSAEPHVSRHHVERLNQYADVLQNERICDRAVLPRSPAKTCSDRYQDLGHSGRAHCKLGSLQQCLELILANVDRYQRVSAGVVMIESSCKPFAFVDG